MELGYKKLIYKKLFWGVIIHAGVLWLALSLGYGSYKEFMKGIEPLTGDVKALIKAAFPWAILIFSGLYFIVRGWKREVEGREKLGIFLTAGQYGYVITFYTILLNLFFFSKGRDIFIPLNLSVVYSVILLTVLLGLSRLLYFENLTSDLRSLISKTQDWLPPIIYRFLQANLPKAQAYIKEKPSAPFIIGFMILLIICAFLLIFKHEKTAERVANIAYFSLVIGVGIEVYQLIRYRNADEEEN